jgi:type IV pilus assembly protein PilM
MFNRSSRLLGIDIGSRAVKLIELGQRDGGIKVNAIAIEPLPESAPADGYPADPDQISAAIERAVIAAGTELKQAAVAIPDASIITHTFPVAAELSEPDIETRIRREATRFIPFSPGEVYLDFQIQGTSTNDVNNRDVMMVAARKEYVDWRRRALENAGLITMIVDAEAFALENTYRLLAAKSLPPVDNAPWPDSNRVDILIDMGSVATTLHAFQKNQLIFRREQGFGGDQLTLSIMAAYGLARPEAELAKCSGELPKDYSSTILEPFKQAAAEQIAELLRFFSSTNPYAAIKTIILVGGGAMIAGLAQVVAEATGVATIVGDPFDQTRAGADQLHLQDNAPLFALAFGLALRSLD